MSSIIHRKVWKASLPSIPASATSMATRACSPTAASIFTNSPTTRTFEECCYLLWFGRLPTRAQLQELKLNLARERKLDASIISLLNQAPKHALPMDVLRTIVSALSFYDPEEKVNDAEANLRKAIRLTSQIAYVVAAYDRIRKGKPLSRARPHALTRGELSVPAERGDPERNRRASARHRADPACRPRTECLDLRRARGRRHAQRHALGDHRCHRRFEGPVAWRSQRSRVPHSRSHRFFWRRSGRLRERHAGPEEKDPGIRPSRLSHRRPPRHASADHVARFGQLQRHRQVV